LFYNVAIVEQGTAATCIDIDDQATANQIDTGMIYTNVELACQTTVKADDEVSGTDFSQALVDSQTSSITATTDGSVAVDGDYVVTGATAISSAPTILNSQITGNTVMGAVEDASDDWFAGWTVAGSL
jgi:malate synthase